MGFFSFLFGGKRPTNVEVVADRIWMTAEAKLAGLAKEIDERSMSGTAVILLVAHFPDVLDRLQQLAERQASGAPVKAVLAGDLNAGFAATLDLDESAMIDVIVAERHPLPSEDDRVKAFADELPCRCRFAHHVSLEDPVMKIFAGDWVQSVLSRLGMSEDESIESQLVSRRIRQAQKKIEGRTLGTLRADSAAQWLEKNCPELGS
jgi:hypothetical protein